MNGKSTLAMTADTPAEAEQFTTKLQQEVVKRNCLQQALGLESDKLTGKCAAHRLHSNLDVAACITYEDFLLLFLKAIAIY